MTSGHAGMAYLLRFLADHLSCLFEPPEEGAGRYRIVNSEALWSNGSAWIDLESDVLRIGITRDRSDLIIDFRPAKAPDARRWNVDLVMRLLTGEPEHAGTPDEDAAFVCENLEEIERRFHPENLPATEAELGRLQKVVTKELFK